MACFVVPAAEAMITTIAAKAVKNHETEKTEGISLSRRLGWLNGMLWGGSALLAFEHLWHGELSLFSPFLTAAANSAELSAMLHEMATAGTSMAALVTAVWAVISVAAGKIAEREAPPEPAEEAAV